VICSSNVTIGELLLSSPVTSERLTFISKKGIISHDFHLSTLEVLCQL
jgi:hypothetical protein